MRRTFLLISLLGCLLLGAPAATAAPAAQSTTAWTGYYFSNPNLQGNPVFIRQDASIDFNWGTAFPDASIPSTIFSVRWLRWVYFDTPGVWTFATTTDDGVRLFVDDELVINAWRDQPATTHTATVNLSQAFHSVRMEYYNRSNKAEAHLQIISASFPDWRGEYYSNPTLNGNPVFMRNDFSINFNFGSAGPGGGVPGQKFSARWMKSLFLNAGRYRFTTTSDDGVRLWVDNQLLIDRWRDQKLTTASGEIALPDGNHLIKVEYYNGDGTGEMRLNWTTLSGGAEVWRGEYFDNPSLTGSPAFSRNDAALSFNWGTASPGTGVTQGNWSARWSSKREANLPGYYTVTAISDDGVRVWLDNNPVIDEWHDQSPTLHTAMVYLNAGPHDWRVEYYNHAGTGMLVAQITEGAVEPTTQSQSISVAGDIAIDTTNPSFVKENAGTGWQSAPNGYGGNAFVTKNNVFGQGQYKWARWYAPLPRAGDYEVFVYVPANIATTRNARYWIFHAGANDFRKLNQMLYINQWVSLGVYYFSANGDEYVTVSDVTYEPYLSTTVVADAIRFSPLRMEPSTQNAVAREYILPLADARATLEKVGGKGASLARLANAALPVPNGFHVTTAAYQEFVAANDLQRHILDAVQTTPHETASRTIGGLFAAAAMPVEISQAITQAYQGLPGAQPPVAVRSSATAEDLADLTFAGQQETFLNLRGVPAVLDAVKRCWASLWTPRAIGYRTQNKIDHETVQLAVIVQLLVMADAAGIMFTANPVTGRRDEIIIDAAWGLGETIVSGQVTPDTLVIDKSSHRVIEREIGDKQVMTVLLDKGTAERPVPNDLQRAPVLGDAQIAELTRLGAQIEKLFGMPMDIEWALAEGKLSILQARPITALPQV